MVVEKVMSEVYPESAKAVFDDKIKTKLITKTQSEVQSRCKVCTSLYATIYNNWLTVDGKSYKECQRVALVAFEEEISYNSFSNHAKHHLHDKNIVRKIMLYMSGDNIDPMKVGQGLLQITVDEIIQGEDFSIKKVKIAKDLIKVCGDIERNRAKQPIVDNSQINITQVNNSRSIINTIPNATDTKIMLNAPRTEEKKQRLKELQSKWGNKGSGRIKNLVPKEPPVVRKDKDIIDAELIKDE
jgi:hypothetical protein